MRPTTIADPTLDALVPATPRWRVAVGLVIGVALLVVAGVSASALRPGVIPGSTGGGGKLAEPGGPLTTIQVEGGGAWQRVESVTGPDVAAAWLTTQDPLSTEAPTPVRTLPAVLHRGERAWLVIRWSGWCGARATVRSVGVLGAVRDERLPDVYTPAGMPFGDVTAGPCASGS